MANGFESPFSVPVRYFRDMNRQTRDEPKRLRKIATGLRASARNAKTRGYGKPLIDAAVEIENQAVNLETLADTNEKRTAKQQMPS